MGSAEGIELITSNGWTAWSRNMEHNEVAPTGFCSKEQRLTWAESAGD
jgi:hypothetical protein